MPIRASLIQIDVFADSLFEGNPAAVMPLDRWPPDRLLQKVANENNLSDTAFLVPTIPADATPHDDAHPAYHLRWFTPATEVDLCGHATLAAASYLFEDVHPDAVRLQLWTRSGWLYVERTDGGFTMEVPADQPTPTDIDPNVAVALGVPIVEALRGIDLVYLVEDANTVRDLTPDLSALSKLDVRGIIVTASGAGTGFDFLSRWFGAQAGVAEDPVTGSAHSQIAPLWAERLGRTTLIARQLSPRGGTVRCAVADGRVYLTGNCVRFFEGTATIPD